MKQCRDWGGLDAEKWARKYHTQTADVNLNNLWNVNVAFFPLKDQWPYLPRKLSWGENNKFQRKMDVKTGREEEEIKKEQH